MSRVFISYSRNDKLVVERLATDLADRGLQPWFDNAIEGGGYWREEIVRSITRCQQFVVCLSPDAVKSDWVRREIFLAWSLKKFLVPVVIRPCFELLSNYDETRWIVDQLQLIDLTANYEEGFRKLYQAMNTPIDDDKTIMIFPVSDGGQFHQYIEDRVRQASRFIMIGTGLNVLNREPFTVEVIEKAAAGKLDLEIYLGDSTSPHVEARLIEEEMGQVKPPIGAHGIFKRIEMLLNLIDNYKNPIHIKIRLFRHYPSFALIIVDDDYLIYPYGYATLGNFSPVLKFSRNNLAHQAMISFLDRQYQMIRDASIDAKQHKMHKSLVRKEELSAVAIYFIPNEDNMFYQFGSSVLGYDIRKQTESSSEFKNWVGTSAQYGFHLTITDALYVYNEADKNFIHAQLNYLLRQFQPFSLTNLSLHKGFPSAKSISLRFDDPTGCLESLHFEFTHRINRRAVASNYSLGIAKVNRNNNNERSQLMISRYNAPYILQEFQPHFTLLTNADLTEQDTIMAKLQEKFVAEVKHEQILVDKLALMVKEKGSNYWQLDTEVLLRRDKGVR